MEVRLNRRLAGDVYVGVVPLTLRAECDLAIAGEGVVIDWLVKMVRLPAQRMLDHRLARGDWRRADFNALADCLGSFFATARRVRIQPTVYLDRFRAECRSSCRALRCSGRPELRHAAQYVARRIDAFIYCRKDLLLRRLDDGRVVEGHGDLRPEHICLGSTPRIIDCLEFRADLRFLDPVDELAFLTMECEKIGIRSVGQILFRRYCLRAHDFPPPELMIFYKVIGALVRARIAILHLVIAPPGVRRREIETFAAQRLFQLVDVALGQEYPGEMRFDPLDPGRPLYISRRQSEELHLSLDANLLLGRSLAVRHAALVHPDRRSSAAASSRKGIPISTG